MQKVTLTVAATLLLSACSVYVDGESVDLRRGGETSLTVKTWNAGENSVSCTEGREPYSKGGENGEPLEMGCRNIEQGHR